VQPSRFTCLGTISVDAGEGATVSELYSVASKWLETDPFFEAALRDKKGVRTSVGLTGGPLTVADEKRIEQALFDVRDAAFAEQLKRRGFPGVR
jgi:hypothetical protein